MSIISFTNEASIPISEKPLPNIASALRSLCACYCLRVRKGQIKGSEGAWFGSCRSKALPGLYMIRSRSGHRANTDQVEFNESVYLIPQ